MTKYLLISIQPQHVYNILIGKKTLELRKTVPKDFKGWVYIYCTKTKPYLHRTEKDILKEYPNTERFILNDDPMVAGFDILNGHVVARFWFDEYDKLLYVKDRFYERSYEWCYKKQRKSCLTDEQIHLYGKGKDLYAWHINKLEVFDKPKQLSEFYVKDISGCVNDMEICEQLFALKRPPQSWQYVWVK